MHGETFTPVVTLVIGWILSIFSGSLVVESMFGWHGMGKFYIDVFKQPGL